MLTMADLIAVFSLCLTSFGLTSGGRFIIRLFFIYNDQVNRHWQYLLYKYINIVFCVCQIYVV